jgi:asparagine synthase (glutamine-hydrolysing)
MCGLAGFYNGALSRLEDAEPIVGRMLSAIAHRGPDDEGRWIDAANGIALGQRRLSILDLSPAGHQPMFSASDRYVVVFNGEIYNHTELRVALVAEGRAPVWRGHSDTEVILAAIEAWGVAAALQRMVGMFAIALWDRQARSLVLARDRMGEKPLFYGWHADRFVFASELKALTTLPDWRGEIDRDALCLYLRHSYIPAPWSIYRGIQKLLPGSWLQLDEADLLGKKLPEPKPYWNLTGVVEQGCRHPFTGNAADAANELERLLSQAVGQQMVADVPLGAFLSGGVDSSAIVALMQAQSRRPVKTFTIGFHEQEFNEAEYAKAVARHLGTEHTELYVTAAQALDVVPRLPALYDEPFSDSSQIPTFLVSQMTRQHVTVSLSGDAGDELFGGYSRYFVSDALWRRLQHCPPALRQWLSRAIAAVPMSSWNAIAKGLRPLLPSMLRVPNVGDKAYKFAGLLAATQPRQLYQGFVSHWDAPAHLVIGGREPGTIVTDASQVLPDTDFIQQMMYQDMLTYLPDDILAKVDRAAMGVSLETRVPFLDHRVIEFAWRLPLQLKVSNGVGKQVLRDVLYRYVPRELIERPKQGFAVPLGAWLRGPLRDWAESLISEPRLRAEGYFRPELVRAKWSEHLSGRQDWAFHLWDVLMFQAWLENGPDLKF